MIRGISNLKARFHLSPKEMRTPKRGKATLPLLPEDKVTIIPTPSQPESAKVSGPTPVYNLTEKDLEEFQRYSPILIIPEGERYAPTEMNFDGDWNLLNNADSFAQLRKRYSLKEIFERYGSVYVNKLENVKLNGKKYTVYQYWFYWPFNSFLFDWHDHDLEYVQVYVNQRGEVERVFTSYHFWQNRAAKFFDKLSSKLGPSLKLSSIMRSFPTKVLRREGSIGYTKNASNVILVDNTHPLVIVEPNTHGMVFSPHQSFILTLKGYKPSFIFKPKRFIPMIGDSPDSPFLHGKDERKLINARGNLKNRGFPYNGLIRVKSPLLRKAFWEGAHTVTTI